MKIIKMIILSKWASKIILNILENVNDLASIMTLKTFHLILTRSFPRKKQRMNRIKIEMISPIKPKLCKETT